MLMSLSPFPAPQTVLETLIYNCYIPFTLRISETSPPPLTSGRYRDAGVGCRQIDSLGTTSLFIHPRYLANYFSPRSTAGKIKRDLENERLQIPIQFISGSFGIQCQLSRDIWRTGALGFCNPGVSSQSHHSRWKGLCDCKHNAPKKKFAYCSGV